VTPDAGGASAMDVVASTLERIGRLDPRIGAFVDVLADRAEAEASALATRPAGRLRGLPIGVKELFDVAGGDNSYGSQLRRGRRAHTDATIVERLNAAGAIVIGLTRSHEFGWGITTQHADRGSTRNPWNLDRVPGGSSGGSAAAVAAGLVPLAVGSDTGGSIRIPAAFCGVLGLKTTPGRISRHGGVALAPTFDTPGFLARSVELLDAALAAVAGVDAGDPITFEAPPLAAPPPDATFRFAVPAQLQPAHLTSARVAALDHIAEALRGIGGTLADADAPDAQEMYEIFVPHQMAEAHFVHARVLGTWPSERDGYGADVARRLQAAEQVTVADYVAAVAAARRARAQFLRVFGTVDVLVNVVGATGPSTTGDPDHVTTGDTTIALRDALMPSTVPQNVAGLPSLTVPAGTDEDDMPIGVQLCGPPWSERFLLSVGRRLERAGAITVRTPAALATA
jgi:aspartyl-tRNA(Asn)/glutamyl-tRNA(Gln) amidotransferase subunit A